jgi:hypothetical protein
VDNVDNVERPRKQGKNRPRSRPRWTRWREVLPVGTTPNVDIVDMIVDTKIPQKQGDSTMDTMSTVVPPTLPTAALALKRRRMAGLTIDHYGRTRLRRDSPLRGKTATSPAPSTGGGRRWPARGGPSILAQTLPHRSGGPAHGR